jgi:hypothetical protein
MSKKEANSHTSFSKLIDSFWLYSVLPSNILNDNNNNNINNAIEIPLSNFTIESRY